MSVNITETKFASSTNVSVGDFDVIGEGHMMYDNKEVKFPVKKVPSNNEMFSKGKTKDKVVSKKKTLSKGRQRRLSARRRK